MTHSPEAIAAALNASRAHWRKNLAAETPDEASVRGKDCALCGLFWRPVFCVGCPVYGRTGQRICGGTPYDAARYALIEWSDNPTSPEAKAAWRVAAVQMCEFLEGLEP